MPAQFLHYFLPASKSHSIDDLTAICEAEFPEDSRLIIYDNSNPNGKKIYLNKFLLDKLKTKIENGQKNITIPKRIPDKNKEQIFILKHDGTEPTSLIHDIPNFIMPGDDKTIRIFISYEDVRIYSYLLAKKHKKHAIWQYSNEKAELLSVA